MSELSKIKNLEKLWVYTRDMHRASFPESELEPIMGGGRLQNPKFMFVFINPTYKNVSSEKGWEGKRRPWIGTKYIWKIFRDAGHFDEGLLAEIAGKKEWDVGFADKVYQHLSYRDFYFTNLVKWTGENADLPNSHKVKLFLPILKKEIELVNPRFVVTFGQIPFSALTNEVIKLGDYYDESVSSGSLRTFSLVVENKRYEVIPSYFPVGRGNPKRGTKILSLLP